MKTAEQNALEVHSTTWKYILELDPPRRGPNRQQERNDSLKQRGKPCVAVMPIKV